MGQIVGQSCGHCQQTVAVITRGLACPGCQRAYHKDCFASAPGCVDCGPEPTAAEAPPEPSRRPVEIVLGLAAAVVLMAVVIGRGLIDETPAGLLLAELETDRGVIRLELYGDKAPKTVQNFVNLSQRRFYDGLIFHRVIPGFMIQTGDPNGDGSGGPGYSFPDEFHESLRHDSAGVLSMANSGPNTNGSQFFITLAPQKRLDGKHAVFGRVVDGLDVCKEIALLPRNDRDRPFDPPKIISITIRDPAEGDPPARR